MDETYHIPGLPPSLADVPHMVTPSDNRWRQEWLDWRMAMLEYRAWLHDRMESPTHQQIADEVTLCRASTAYLSSMWMSVYEPRRDQPLGMGYIPFIPLSPQMRIWQWMKERNADPEYGHGLMSKPRKVAATWAVLADDLKGWLFEFPWDIRLISHKEDQVDRTDDPDSMFWKIDHLIASLPDWLRPTIRRGKERRNLLLKHPSSGALFTGEASTKRATRGGRSTGSRYDEAAFWQIDFRGAWETGKGTTDHALCWSSESQEFGLAFESIREEMEREHPEAVLKIDYQEHPLWDEEWARKERKKYEDSAAFDREFGRKGGAGLNIYVYPEAMSVRPNALPPDPKQNAFITIDPGGGKSQTVIEVYQERGPWMDLVACYADINKPAAYYATILLDRFVTGPNGYTYSREAEEFASLVGSMWSVEYFGDPMGHQRWGIEESWYDLLNDQARELTDGRVQIRVRHSWANKDRRLPHRRDTFRKMLARTRYYPGSAEVLKCVKAWQEHRYPKRADNHNQTTTVDESVHDWTWDYTSAAEYLAVNLLRRFEIEALMKDKTLNRIGYADPHGKRTITTVGSVPVMR